MSENRSPIPTPSSFPIRPVLGSRTYTIEPSFDFDPEIAEADLPTERRYEISYRGDRFELGTSFEAARDLLRTLTEAHDAGEEIFACSWLVEYRLEGDRFTRECGAPAKVLAEGGFVGIGCGHAHDPRVSYLDADEIAGGHLVTGPALAMDGSPILS